MNASYASPVADAAFAGVKAIAPEGLVAHLLSGVNGWTVALMVLLSLVAYDQSRSFVLARISCSRGVQTRADEPGSHVQRSQGHHCRTRIQDAIYRTLPRVGEP